MTVASAILTRALRSLWAQCLAANPRGKLRDMIDAQATASLALVTGAGSISLNTANGQTTEFAKFGAGNITMLQVVEVWEYLLVTYDNSAASLSLPSDGSADSQIFADMIVALRPIKGYTDNYQFLSK